MKLIYDSEGEKIDSISIYCWPFDLDHLLFIIWFEESLAVEINKDSESKMYLKKRKIINWKINHIKFVNWQSDGEMNLRIRKSILGIETSHFSFTNRIVTIRRSSICAYYLPRLRPSFHFFTYLIQVPSKMCTVSD